MLDPRIYRTAFLPVLLAVLVAAFSLEDRPRAIGTTIAPDAFNGAGAERTLADLARAYPVRRAGDAGDEALARDVATRLRAIVGRGGTVRIDRFKGRTLDGKADLANVIAQRPGRPGPGLVIVAHRDAARRGSVAELSGTAALLELARVSATARLQRTVTFISTSGGSGGLSGAIRAAQKLHPSSVGAVLVLGDVAGPRVRKPWVVPWADGDRMAPLRLRRTVELAVRTEVGSDPGGFRASTQFARQALGVAPTEQGPFGARGMPAVLLSVSGEQGPRATDGMVPDRMAAFGQSALRAILALDNGPDLSSGPAGYVVTKKKLLPGWAIRLLAGGLLLPVWVAAVDAYVRARRRHAEIGRWALWVLATALPFSLAAAMAVVLGLTGMIEPAPGSLVLPGTVAVDGAAITALVVLGLVVVLGFLVIRPLALRVIAGDEHDGGDASGPAAGVVLCISGLTVVVWVFNPFAAMTLVPAAHLWLFGVSPVVRKARVVAVLSVVAGLMAPLAVILAVADGLSASLADVAWLGVLGVAGRAFGPIGWLAWSVFCGCAVCALLLAVRPPQREELLVDDVTSRGPLGYAGPGSLGGTQSALRP